MQACMHICPFRPTREQKMPRRKPCKFRTEVKRLHRGTHRLEGFCQVLKARCSGSKAKQHPVSYKNPPLLPPPTAPSSSIGVQKISGQAGELRAFLCQRRQGGQIGQTCTKAKLSSAVSLLAAVLPEKSSI